MQKLPLQPPYYDMAPSESTPFTDKPVSSDATSRFKGSPLWRGRPRPPPWASCNCQWKGELFCAIVLRGIWECISTWICSAVMLAECHRGSLMLPPPPPLLLIYFFFFFCLSSIKSGWQPFLTSWPVNPLAALNKLLISSFTSAPLTSCLNLGYPVCAHVWTCARVSSFPSKTPHLLRPRHRSRSLILHIDWCVCMATVCR